MYGLVSNTIEDLVTQYFGINKWEAIQKKCSIEEIFFNSNEAYNDDNTCNSAIADFGDCWDIKTTKEKYSKLMQSGGTNLKDILIDLPMFHNRLMLIYPKLTLPEFKISEINVNSLNLHYIAKRKGLQEFVRGLIQGLSKIYETPMKFNFCNLALLVMLINF